MKRISLFILCLITTTLYAQVFNARLEGTQKPVLHGNQRIAITGKTLAATAGAVIFQKGGLQGPGLRFDVRRNFIFRKSKFVN